MNSGLYQQVSPNLGPSLVWLDTTADLSRTSLIAESLTNLLRKQPNSDLYVPYIWDTFCQQAFQELKNRLTHAPVLRNMDPNLKFTVTTDASNFAIGAVISQDDGQGHRPIAFKSRKLSPAEQKLATHEKELLAIIYALKTWQHYLEGVEFDVITDHRSLQYINTQPTLFRQ